MQFNANFPILSHVYFETFYFDIRQVANKPNKKYYDIPIDTRIKSFNNVHNGNIMYHQ